MLKKITTILFAICCISIIGVQLVVMPASAESWYNYSMLKITIETEENIYEWEYENPNSFEYEEGTTVIRGEKAKASFEAILSIVDLGTPTITKETIKKLEKNNDYDQIQRLVVQQRDRNYNHKSWIWSKNK